MPKPLLDDDLEDEIERFREALTADRFSMKSSFEGPDDASRARDWIKTLEEQPPDPDLEEDVARFREALTADRISIKSVLEDADRSALAQSRGSLLGELLRAVLSFFDK